MIIVLACMLLSFFYGIATIHYKIFPYQQVKLVVNVISANTKPKHSAYFYDKTSFFEQHATPPYDVVMIGDSLTDGAEWQDLFPSLKLANRGINGDRTDEVLDRLESIHSTSAPKAFIMLGVNDFLQGRGGEEVFGHYQSIASKLVEWEMKVFIQSTILAGKQDKQINKKITLLNNRLQHLAKQSESITFIDINVGLAPNSFLSSKYSQDGIHLNGHGYAVWKKFIAPYIHSNK